MVEHNEISNTLNDLQHKVCSKEMMCYVMKFS